MPASPPTLRWQPKTRLQAETLNSPADIAGLGGSAGSLKSFTLLADAVQEFRNPNLRAILFRETFPNLGQIIRYSHQLYRGYPYFGRYNGQDHVWSFPVNAREIADPANFERVASGELKPVYVAGSGATIRFAYLGRYDDVFDHQSFEYSWIGFDEATHFTEEMVQYMLTRLRSTDTTLRLRMRLATNPGGIGHRWFMRLFVGEDCPHCHPGSSRCRIPYMVYKDATWTDGTPLTQVIDGVEIQYTTQFIPGNLKDHQLFGQGNMRYRAQLRMQRAATAKALEEGCWAMFEGQYFDVWEENRGVTIDDVGNVLIPKPDMRMVINRNDVDIEYWWPHFTGNDYGFTNSSTAGYLCVRTPADKWFPNGRIYVLDEYCEPRTLAEDAALAMLRKWLLDENDKLPELPRAIQMWALSPDAFNATGISQKVGDVGISITRADQMNAVMGRYNQTFIRAANERPGGWQHIYRMLRSGELVICGDTCPKLVQALPSRIRDPKKADDILKVNGDELDDCVDAIRYAVYSWFKVGAKPVALELADRVRDLSPTDAMITRLKYQGEIKAKSAPAFVGARANARQRLYEQSLRTKRRR